jgi:hypothetical protein
MILIKYYPKLSQTGDEPHPNLKRMSSECEANVKKSQSDIVTE